MKHKYIFVDFPHHALFIANFQQIDAIISIMIRSFFFAIFSICKYLCGMSNPMGEERASLFSMKISPTDVSDKISFLIS